MLNLFRSWDPLYGRIEFTEFEYGLLRLPEVQRLRYVRMCNINSLLVTGASEISRFEHTIGVLHLTKIWCKAHGVTGLAERNLLAAAVLHDIQTGPFGHSMQYVLEDNHIDEEFIHEDISHGWKSTYHQEVLAGATFAGRPFSAQLYLKDSWSAVTEIIKGNGRFGPLISGTLDLDNIDNVIRLAFHTGVAKKSDAIIAESLAKNLLPVNGGISLSEEFFPVVKRWQIVRKDLYSLLLLDWAEFSSKAMLTRAIEKAANYDLIGADSWIRTDAEFLEYLEKNAIGDAQEIRDLVRRIRCGDLYFPVYLGTSASVEFYSRVNEGEAKIAIEQLIVHRANVKGVKILIHFILDKGKTERQISVANEMGEIKTIGNSSKRLLCGIFAASSITEGERSALKSAFMEILSEYGVKDIELLMDPMGAPQMSQKKLI